MRKLLALIGFLLATPAVAATLISGQQINRTWKLLGGLGLGINVTAPHATLDVGGRVSGSSITVSGLNASACDLKSTNGVVSCGVDATGGGSPVNFGTGNVLTINQQTDNATSTGQLVRAFGPQFVQSSTGALKKNFQLQFLASSTGALKNYLHPLGEARYVNASGDTMTGSLALTGSSLSYGLSGPAGAARDLVYLAGGVKRWALRANNTAEGGANAGSNFAVVRYDDAGTALDSPILVRRSNGFVQVGASAKLPSVQLEAFGGMSGSSLAVSALPSCGNLQTASNGALSCNNALYLATSTGALKSLFDTLYFRSSTGSLKTFFDQQYLRTSTGSLKTFFDANYFRTSTGSLKAYLRPLDEARYVNTAGDTMTGNLLVKAVISGSSLRVDNLKNCDTIDTNSAGVLSCGTDANGGAGSFDQAAADQRYVRRQGDTATGGLLLVNGGHAGLPAIDAGLLLEVAGTASGRHLHAQDLLTASGDLVADRNLLVNATPAADNTVEFRAASGVSLFYVDAAAPKLSLFDNHGKGILRARAITGEHDLDFYNSENTQVFALSGSPDQTVFVLANPKNEPVWEVLGEPDHTEVNIYDDDDVPAFSFYASGSTIFEAMGTASGRVLHAQDRLESSGTLVVKGQANLEGLANCDTIDTDASGKLSCGTDATGGGGGTFGSGNVLSIGNSKYVKKAGDTMTGMLVLQLGGNNGKVQEQWKSQDGRVQARMNGSGALTMSGRLWVIGPTFPNNAETDSAPYSRFDVGRFEGNNSGSFIDAMVMNRATVNATSDLVVLNSSASDTTGYIDLGFTSQTYNVAGGGEVGPSEGYLLTPTGPMSIGTENSGSSIKFFIAPHNPGVQMGIPTSAEAMRIQGPAGYVGINTKTVQPKARLTVFGSGAFTQSLSGASLSLMNTISCANLQTASNGALSCNNALYLASSTGSLQTFFNTKYQTIGGYLATSTGALKTNFGAQFVQSSTGALRAVFDNRYVASSTGSLRATLYGFGQGLSRTVGGLVTLNQNLTGATLKESTKIMDSGSLVVRGLTTLSGGLVIKNFAGLGTGNLLVIDTKGLVYDGTNKRVGIAKLAPSVALDVVGGMSGSSLNVTSLVSCTNLQTNTAGALSCNNTAYTTAATEVVRGVGQGLSLASGLLTLSLSNSGSLSRYTTMSGVIVRAKDSLSSSGTLAVLGKTRLKDTLNGTTLSGNALAVMGGNSYVLGNVGLGFSGTPETRLEVVGTASGTNLTASALPSCNYLSTTSAGALQCGTTLPVAAGGTALSSLPNRSIVLSAGGARPSTLSGSVPQSFYFPTNSVDVAAQSFNATGSMKVSQWTATMPDNYDGGTLTAKFYWTAKASAASLKWFIQCRSYGDAEGIDQAWGSSGSVLDTAGSASGVLVSAATPAVTCSGTPAGGELVQFRVYRVPNDGSDTLGVTGSLLSVKLKYLTNSYTD